MKRTSPRRVIEDLANICFRERQARYAGRSGWRRLAYAAVLTGKTEAVSPPVHEEDAFRRSSLGLSVSEVSALTCHHLAVRGGRCLFSLKAKE